MTIFGMAPILWMIVFIIGYAIYLYTSSINNESIENKKDEDVTIKKVSDNKVSNNNHESDAVDRSVGSWMGIFFVGTILFIGLLFIIYFFNNFHGM